MMLLFPIATDMMLLALQQFTIAHVIWLDMESSIYEFNSCSKTGGERRTLWSAAFGSIYRRVHLWSFNTNESQVNFNPAPQHICISCGKIYEELFFLDFTQKSMLRTLWRFALLFWLSEWHFIIYTADHGGMSVLVFRNTVVHPSISNGYYCRLSNRPVWVRERTQAQGKQTQNSQQYQTPSCCCTAEKSKHCP